MSHDQTPAEIEERLWSEVQKARYGMLGLVGRAPAEHFQPMTAFCERENGLIWFFTRRETNLARAADQGGPAMFIVQAKDQGFQACLGGKLTQHFDPVRMEKFWNPIVDAWYPEGKDDPSLTLLRLELDDAQVWLSETNPVAFAFQITQANWTHREPDVGQSAHLDLKPY